MSMKPTDVIRWANVGGAITIPPSGKQNVGWVAGEAPPAEYFNWLANGAFLWFQYLNDGDCQFHNLSTVSGGTLSVAGAATFSSTVGITGLLTASGGITVPTGQALTLAGTATLTTGTGALTFGGAATFASTVGITGLLTASGGITVPTGQAVTLSGTTTLTAGGLITASNGLTAAANKDVTVSGTGRYRHGTRTLPIHSSMGRGLSGITVTLDGVKASYSGASAILDFPILLEVGKTIKAIRVYCADNATGTTQITAIFTSTDATVPSQTSIANSGASAGTGAQQVLSGSLATLNTTIAAGHTYDLECKITNGSSTVTINSVEVDYID